MVNMNFSNLHGGLMIQNLVAQTKSTPQRGGILVRSLLPGKLFNNNVQCSSGQGNVFVPGCSTQEVYESVAKPVVQKALEGYHGKS